MVLFGVVVKTWHGVPSSHLVVTKAGEGYWADSFDAARTLADEVEADVGNPAQLFSVEYFPEAVVA